MNNIYLMAVFVAFVFFIVKLFEIKYFSDEEPKPIKLIIRDVLSVYVCTIIGYYIIEQLKPFIEGSNIIQQGIIPAFTTDAPF